MERTKTYDEDIFYVSLHKKDEQVLCSAIEQYNEWVYEFLNNSYKKELEKIATGIYPKGVFTEEGFNDYQLSKSKALLEKSVKYLKMARAIIASQSKMEIKNE